MTERPTTEELAANIRRLGRDKATHAEITRPIAHDLIEELQLRLPYLAPADVGAVLMHSASCITGLVSKFRGTGVAESTVTTLAINTLAIAGERMDHKARRAGRSNQT